MLSKVTSPEKRRYHSPKRQAQAATTRREIIDAAGRLFAALGYGQTTMAAIADEAGVAVETIYAACGPKNQLLLSWVDEAVAGDDEAVAIIDRDWVQSLRDESDQKQQLRLLVHAVTEIAQRAAVALEVFRAAASADADIAQLWHEADQRRLQDQTELINIIANRGPLRHGLDASSAADVLWTLASPQTYLALVCERGWSNERFEQWLTDTLTYTLLA